MAAQRAQLTGIDRLAAMLEPAFPLRMLGFGLIYAWSTCLWDLVLPGTFANGQPLQSSVAWALSAAITPLACLAGCLAGRTRELADFRSLYVAGPALTAVGTVFALAAPLLAGPLSSVAVALAGIGTGIGPVVLILLWACLFARTETGIVETVVPASFVATLACALVVPVLPATASAVAVSALPLASGALLLLSKRALDTGKVPPADKHERPSRETKRTNIARMFLVIFAVYGIGCLQPAASHAPVPATAETTATIVGVLLAVALSASFVLFSRRINLEALFRWITVPFVFAIVCTALDTTPSAVLSRVLANVVFTGIEIIMVLYFVRLAQKTDRTATFLVSLGECAAYAGVFLGYVAQPPIQAAIASGALDPKTLCLLLVGAFAVVTLLVPHRDAALDAQAAVGAAPAWEAAGAPAPARPRLRATRLPLRRRLRSAAPRSRANMGFRSAKPRYSRSWHKGAAALTSATRSCCPRTPWPRISATFTRSWAYIPSKNSSTWWKTRRRRKRDADMRACRARRSAGAQAGPGRARRSARRAGGA